MKLFIWDFHGTLEKGNEKPALILSNMALARMGHQEQFTIEQINRLYGKPWYKYFEYILPNESHDQHIKIVKTCLSIEREDPGIIHKYILPNDNAHGVLKKIQEANHDQVLVSNAEEDALDMFVKSVKMELYFPKEKRFATNHHDGTVKTTKQELIKSYIDKNQPDEIITIGDTAKDITVVAGPNVTSYLYAHPGKAFAAGCNPTYKIRDLREILKEL